MCRSKLLIFLFFFSSYSLAQVNTSNIEIVRDSWGVPHIYGKTDKEAAYGLAWAHAEDDFATIQKTFLPAKGLLGSLDGIRGAVLDFAVELLKSREVANRELKNLPPEGLNVIYGYLEGLNAYANKYPEKVLVKGSFPLSIYDYLTGLNLMLHLFSDTGDIIGQLLSNSINPIDEMSGVDNIGSSIGSNGFAFNSQKTTDGKSYLNINTHQPLEGPFAWYEAHVNSDEGWNMLGGLFPGLPLPVIGTNENLGWTHTYNYPDMNDVFQLVINPKNKNQYKLDGQWEDFEKEIEDACLEGGSSLHGTGIAPGWLSDLVPLTMSGMSEEISEVRVTESSEFSYYPSEEIVFDTMLMGKSLQQYEQESVRYEGWITGLFSEAIYLIADGIGSNIVNIEKSIDLITSNEDKEIAAGVVKKGTISGQRRKWIGHCDNNVEIIQEAIWRAYPDAAPEWNEPVGMCVEIKGKPNMKIDFDHGWNDDPLVSTALHGVHAIPMVCEASPGFKSFLDLPLISSKFN